ncbi:hypothetical protein E2C01_095280 [Portunus trituberculatus]|uniref:Uncharacterized protein n=1 Tax=Portunus trituberculatus TaxID=210409 RepID=A0A5B7JYC5_PORTR|nr:hypothetical protein [Portunus trituberculatus]
MDTYSQFALRYLEHTKWHGGDLFSQPFWAHEACILYIHTSITTTITTSTTTRTSVTPRPSMTIVRIIESPAVSRVRSSSVNHISMSNSRLPACAFGNTASPSRPGAVRDTNEGLHAGGSV